MKIEDSQVIFSSGRKRYAHRGLLAIEADPWFIHFGRRHRTNSRTIRCRLTISASWRTIRSDSGPSSRSRCNERDETEHLVLTLAPLAQ
jgi:hypothetical protein